MTTTPYKLAAASHVLLRLLAPLDACLLPGAALYWISTWKASGGLIEAVLSALALYWAASRAGRAVFDFWNYRWMTLRLAKVALTLIALMWCFQLIWKAQA